MFNPEDISDPTIKSWFLNNRKPARAMLVEQFNGQWAKVFSRNLTLLNIPVVVFSLYHKIEIEGVRCINTEIKKCTHEIDYSRLEKILVDEDINIVFLHASFERPSIKFTEYIESRNAIIEHYRLPLQKIDVFYFEGGFLRPSLYQLDNVGWNLWNSITDKSLEQLTAKQNEELDKWLVEYREEKTQKLTLTKEELCDKFKIPLSKQIVLCGMQVPRDSVLLHFAPWCNHPAEFIEKCIKIFPQHKFHLIFKRHPKDTEHSILLDLIQNASPENCTYVQEEEYNTGQYLMACDVVCVVNSTMGCEGLAFNKPVVNLGFAAYRYATIPCWNDDEKSISNMLKQLETPDSYTARARQVLYQIITNSPGLKGLHFRDLVNKKSRYTKL